MPIPAPKATGRRLLPSLDCLGWSVAAAEVLVADTATDGTPTTERVAVAVVDAEVLNAFVRCMTLPIFADGQVVKLARSPDSQGATDPESPTHQGPLRLLFVAPQFHKFDHLSGLTRAIQVSAKLGTCGTFPSTYRRCLTLHSPTSQG